MECSLAMIPSSVINEEVETQYCVICGVGSGETTEVDFFS